MQFNDFDKQMRVFETSLDQVIIPDIYIVVRLDGKEFTRLTHREMNFEAPFDIRFHQYMVKTTEQLMKSGFNVVYGYTQSDEISLLLSLDDSTFSRKTRKINSILAGTASACFSLQLGKMAVFDSRVVPLPNKKDVEDYFLWRQEDAHRNSLNSHCYWMLRKQGKNGTTADHQLRKLTIDSKNELLFQNGINYNDQPSWQKRGTGLYFKEIKVDGYNPKTNQKVVATRRRLFVDEEIPLGDGYREFIDTFL